MSERDVSRSAGDPSDPALEIVQLVVDAIEHADWVFLKSALHPYLHWTDDAGIIRGRNHVLAHLREHPTAGRPSAYELRDGQMYRWSTGGMVSGGMVES